MLHVFNPTCCPQELQYAAVACARVPGAISALPLFQPLQGEELHKQHAEMPLDPALEHMRREIRLQSRSISRCVDELSAVLKSWMEGPGPGRGPHLSVDSLDSMVTMQASALSDLTLAIATLEAQMAHISQVIDCDPSMCVHQMT